MRLKIPLVALVLMLSLAAWGQGGFQATMDSTAAASTPSVDLSKVHIDQDLGAQVPMTAQFKDWDGTTVTFGTLLGTRPAILVPIWYNCTGVCNVELQNLLTTIDKLKTRKLGTDYEVIVMSINPSEGPELAAGKRKNVLNTLEQKGTDKGWHFLTGTMPNIRAVTDAVGFHFTYDPVKNFANHPAGLMVLSPTGQVSSYLYGANYAVPTVQADLDTAKQGRIGAKSEELFFGCIHCDPITGKKSIVVENVLRLMGVLTVIVLVGSILTLSGKKFIRR
jgi:protein SCO1/2